MANTKQKKFAKPLLTCIALAAGAWLAYGSYQHQQVDLARAHDGYKNPFRGLPGCVHLVGDAPALAHWPLTKAAALGCQTPALPPASIGMADALVAKLWQMVQEPVVANPNAKAQAQVPTAGAAFAVANTVEVAGRKVAQGQSIALTLSAKDQVAAQTLADCMTQSGAKEACERANVPGDTWAHRYENAAASQLALVDIDLTSGGIRALASANSPCTTNYWQALGPAGSDCPARPTLAQAQAWRNDNAALYATAMPGSTDKPWLILSLLRSADGPRFMSGAGRQQILHILKTSASADLLSLMLCADSGFKPTCPRLAHLASTAQDIGFDARKINLLGGQKEQGQATPSPALWVGTSRLFQTLALTDAATATTASASVAPTLAASANAHQNKRHTKEWQWLQPTMPEAPLLAACKGQDYEKCSGQDLTELLSELWGQGSGQATALSAARMVARLGAAANGKASPEPHLLAAAQVPGLPQGRIAQAHAQLITQGMGLSHRGGNASASCVAALGSVKACQNADYFVGKTGTPAFTHEALSDRARQQHCDANESALTALRNTGDKPTNQQQLERQRCQMQAHKWYIALVRDGGGYGPFTRAIAVLADRNYERSGWIDSRGDHGVNVAAELAMRYIRATSPAAKGSISPSSNHKKERPHATSH